MIVLFNVQKSTQRIKRMKKQRNMFQRKEETKTSEKILTK